MTAAQDPGPLTTSELLLRAWDPGAFVPLACAVALGAYAWKLRGRHQGRAVFFVLAVTLFFLALASPVGVLARGYLFSAHMLQHLLLMLAVPPLVFLGLPPARDADVPFATAKTHAPARDRAGTALSWLAGVGAMWVWHARTLCNAAAVSREVQVLQTVSLVGMGLAFWRPILGPRREGRMDALPAVAYLFTACIACTVLGIVVTLSPVEVCSAYLTPVDSLGALPLLREGWGMSCKADQELGGLLMWVPACLVYLAAIVATLGRYYAGETPSRSAPAAGTPRAPRALARDAQ